jgi:hypothetical protein
MINGSFACGFGMMEEASMRKFWVKLDRLDISGCLV